MAVDERQALIGAAVRMIRANSFKQASLARIESEAGVSSGAFSRSFRTVNELIDAALSAIKEDLLDVRAERQATPALKSTDAGEGRKSRTRAALIAAGKRCMRNGSIDSVSIDDLVRDAGVGKGSFFNHFSSRTALIEAVLDVIHDELDAKIAEATAGVDDPLERVLRTLVVGLKYRIDNKLRPQALHNYGLDSKESDAFHYLQMRGDLRLARLKKRIEVPSIESVVVATMAISELGSLRLLDFKQDARAVEALTRSLCEILLASLGVDVGRDTAMVKRACQFVL